MSPKAAFAVCLDWPGEQLVLQSLRAKPEKDIFLLCYDQPLSWSQDGTGLVIQFPEFMQKEINRPCRFAYIVKIPVQEPFL